MYNQHQRVWQERTTLGTTWLSVQIPREVLPVELRHVRVDVEVAGPMGRLELLGLKSGQPASLGTKMDPVGSFKFDPIDVSLLPVSAEGTIALGIAAGDPDRSMPSITTISGDRHRSAPVPHGSESAAESWRIVSLQVQVSAVASDGVEQP
jgi:hypothetical protein